MIGLSYLRIWEFSNQISQYGLTFNKSVQLGKVFSNQNQ